MSKEAAAGPTPERPSKIGKYSILDLIGQGAMGQVFRALDPVLNRHVAIKMMAPEVSSDPMLSQRFLREAQSAAQLNHPNIVTLHDFGEDQGQLYMAMELLEGQDLSKVLKQRRLETLEDKLALMEQACDGLAFAHSMKLVHRDLKPANIHVHTSGRVKIMDFGLARASGSDMTRAGTIMGSPNYMSPEQVRGERADARSDVFALGLVFYEVLSGRRAFDAEAVHAILYKVANTDPEPLQQLCPDLSPILVELVEKALRKDPRQRFADAVEMREALDVCRKVLDGSLDEETGRASLREARTIVQAPDPASRAAVENSDTLSSTAETRPAIARRSGTGPLRSGRLGQSGSLPVVRPPAPTVNVPSAALGSGAVQPHRAGLYLAAGVSVLALAAAAYFALRQRPAPPPQASDAQTALMAVAVESQLEVARKSLEYKDLHGAISAADKALRMDPANAEAQSIKARAKVALGAVEAAVREAREAAQSGDVEKATQAVSRVLAQMPDHPIAAELAPQLNSHFQSRAEEALRQAKVAADAARRANASSLREYADAARLSRQAEELLKRQQFTEATQKALEAKKAYEIARAAAGELAAKPTLAPPSAAPPAVAGVPVAAAPTAAPPTPAPLVASVAPPVAPGSTVAAGPSDEALVKRVIGEFARAIEAKDIGLYKSLRPGLSGDDERKLRAAFENVRSQEVELAIESVSIDGLKAVARVVRSGKVNGQPVPTLRQVFRLAKRPSGWVIDDIGQ